MEGHIKRLFAVALLFPLSLAVTSAYASPDVDSAIIKTRLWNDDSDSVLTTTNNYPTLIAIEDTVLDGDGMGGEYANRHNFRLSDNGGVSEAVFMNNDSFAFYADVTISGTGNAEGGLNLSPWWSQDFDGGFMIRTTDGEIACFGGRLPFYNFTTSQSLTYTKGDTVNLGFVYRPRGLSELNPATIEYKLFMGGTDYTSGALEFDEGNPDEDPPYGLWGILNDARVGGWFQPYIVVADPLNGARIEFENLDYIPEPATVTLFGLIGLAVLRRRR
jgi:hypothetical protein